MYILGDKTTKETLFVSGIFSPTIDKKTGKDTDGTWTKEKAIEQLKRDLPEIIDSNISYLKIADNSLEAKRFINLDSYEIVWEGDEISLMDFSPEDNKKTIHITTDKDIIDTDNENDTALITFKIKNSDGSIAPLNKESDIEIITPKGNMYVKLKVINGEGSLNFKPPWPGTWIFPSALRISDFNVKNFITIKARLNI